MEDAALLGNAAAFWKEADRGLAAALLARAYALEALGNKGPLWDGQVAHWAHVVLGRIALAAGDVDAAAGHLVAAGWFDTKYAAPSACARSTGIRGSCGNGVRWSTPAVCRTSGATCSSEDRGPRSLACYCPDSRRRTRGDQAS